MSRIAAYPYLIIFFPVIMSLVLRIMEFYLQNKTLFIIDSIN